MLAEFAAAAVNFLRAIEESNKEGNSEDQDKCGITAFLFKGFLEGILKESHHQIFPYYSSCLERLHKYFTWTGPKL